MQRNSQRQHPSPPMYMPRDTRSGTLNFEEACSPTVGCFEKTGFARSTSMDLTNDPRFFSDNVIDKRLAAFSGLAVVSGLMVQNAIDQSFDMRKDLDFSTVEGWFQCIGFVMLSFVLFTNMLATYIGVAQPYHTYRLMTAGPAGFETAAAYYLDRNICSWRHAAVRLMLLSLPVFLVSSAFRFVPKFSRVAVHGPQLPQAVPRDALETGICVCIIYGISGIALLLVHRSHQRTFAHKYEIMWHASGMGDITATLQDVMSTRSRNISHDPLDA